MKINPQFMLQPTRQEKASGFLLAMLILLGSLTLFLLSVWLSQKRPDQQRPVSRIDLRWDHDRASGSTGASETAKTLEDQGTDEQALPTEQAAELLTVVSSLVSSELTILDGEGGSPKGTGVGDEIGDGRKTGRRRPDGDVIPSWERWQIRFSAANVQE